MKRILFVLSTLVLFACNENEQEEVLISNKKYLIKVETVCKSGNTRKYEIKEAQYENIKSYIENVGSDCTWVEVQTTSDETKKGYFVELYKE